MNLDMLTDISRNPFQPINFMLHLYCNLSESFTLSMARSRSCDWLMMGGKRNSIESTDYRPSGNSAGMASDNVASDIASISVSMSISDVCRKIEKNRKASVWLC